MKPEYFSKTYYVRKLDEKDIENIESLCIQNTLYYEYCPPLVNQKIIKEDMISLPPGKTMKDKYYVGYFKDNRMIAVMDIIDGYPDKDIAFIGFFMMNKEDQGKNIGTSIIEELCEYLKENYQEIRLAWVNGNPQAQHFWLKNHFLPLKETQSHSGEDVILASRKINRRSDY